MTTRTRADGSCCPQSRTKFVGTFHGRTPTLASRIIDERPWHRVGIQASRHHPSIQNFGWLPICDNCSMGGESRSGRMLTYTPMCFVVTSGVAMAGIRQSLVNSMMCRGKHSFLSTCLACCYCLLCRRQVKSLVQASPPIVWKEGVRTCQREQHHG